MSLPNTEDQSCTLCGESAKYPVEITEHAGHQDVVTWTGTKNVAVFDTRYFCSRLCLQAWLNLERIEQEEDKKDRAE